MPLDPVFYFDIFLVLLVVCIAMMAVVRITQMPNGVSLFLLLLLSLVTMTEEFIFASGSSKKYLFIHGMTMFWPLVNSAILIICIRRLLQYEAVRYKLFLFAPAILIAAIQLPIFQLSDADKLRIFITGELDTSYDFYLMGLSSLSYLVSAAYGAACMTIVSEYNTKLPLQVADVELYKLRPLHKLLLTYVLIALAAAAMPWMTATQEWLFANPFRYQTLPHVISIMILGVYLMDIRYFAPQPKLPRKPTQFSDAEMVEAIRLADEAVIKLKAYKKPGIRITQLAKAAKIEPELLVTSLRRLEKMSFKTFIFKYRLEYAKKLLLLTDESVGNIANRLGFRSQTFLVNTFEKHMKMKLQEFRDIGKDVNLVDWE